MNSTGTISILNRLIETLKDGQEGFRAASEGVTSPQLKELFNRLSLQRSQFAGELQKEVIGLGEPKPEDSSSVAGALHRGWIDLKSALSSRDEHAVLAECERGEDSAVAAYKKAFEEELPQNIREVVQKQAGEIKAAHDQVKQLRDIRAK